MVCPDGSSEPTGKLLLIQAHMFLRMMGGCLQSQTEPIHIVALCQGDHAAAMHVLTTVSGATGLPQFLLNPTFGTLSDRYGRRPFFIVGPACSCLANVAIATSGNRWVFAAMRALGKTVLTLSGSTTSMAAMADCVSGERLTAWSAYTSASLSVGVIVGGL